MNEERFSGKAAIYRKFRPNYPEALIDYLYSEVGLATESIIADIGAGTGIFSKLLAQRNSSIICVEPNDDMREKAKQELIDFPNCSFLKASAENTTLNGASIDFVTVAQAFHWFDRNRFKAECARILKPNGKVILVWNARDKSDVLTMETARVNQQFCPDFNGFSGGSDYEDPQAYVDFFKNGYYDFQTFKNDLALDEATFIGRNLSSSYAPREESELYQEYVEQLRLLFQKYSRDGRLSTSIVTKSYVGEV